MTAARGPFRFEGFTFDPVTGELAGPGPAVLRLAPKAARLLALLLERPGELVSRERVRDELWPEQHVELDQVLAYTVRQVRAALGDGAAAHLVETLPRRGYRFVGRVETVAPPAASPPLSGAAPTADVAAAADVAAGANVAARADVATGAGLEAAVDVEAGADAKAPRRPNRLPTVGRAAMIVLATLAAAAALGIGWWRTAPAAEAWPARLALLPLGEPGLEAVNDPLTEALVVALAAQPGIEVVGPATTGRLRGTRRPHTEVGRELAVDYVASGGFRPAQGVLFLQLVRVSDGGHVFARRFYGDTNAVRRQSLDDAASGLAAAATRRREGAGPHD